MSSQIYLTEKVHDYMRSVSLHEPSVLALLREETSQLEMARMQISPEQGQFMEVLLKLMGAKRYLEVGTFTGYSSLVAAFAMGEGSEVHALDNSKEWTAIAKRYWRDAGVDDRITLHLADANDTLSELCATREGEFDFVFVDADKTGYPGYIDAAYVLLRKGGLLLLDNVLWDGAVADPDDQDEDTVALRAVNESMFIDQRFSISMVPVGDGLTLAVKK